jgi:uncharacterized membrane protein
MIGFDWFFGVFRLIHILAGVAWAGGVFLFVVFIQPSAAAIGPAAGPMMGQLLGVRKLVDRFLLLAAITIGAGLVLYVRLWMDRGSLGDWLGSGYGLAITIGMVTAIVAAMIGMLGTRPNVHRLMAIQGAVAGAEGPPTPEQGQEMELLRARLQRFARTSLGLLVVALATMATAQAW